MLSNFKEACIAITGVVGTSALFISVISRNPVLASVSSFGLAGSVSLATGMNRSDKRRELERDLHASQSSANRLASDLLQATQDIERLNKALSEGKEGYARLEAISLDLRKKVAVSADHITTLEGTLREALLEQRALQGDIEALTTENEHLKGQSETQRAEWVRKYDQMIDEYECAIEALKTTLSEYEKELYRFRDSNGLVLEVERGKIALEVKALQDRLTELETLNGSMKSHVQKGREVVEELKGEFEYLTDTAYPEIAQLHEAQLNERDKLLMQLSGQVAEMKKPQQFEQIGNYQRADKLIELLYSEHQIALDASEIEPLDSGAFTVYLNVRDRKARGKAFVEALNELSDWLMVQLACITPVSFSFDAQNPHRIKTTLRYARVPVAAKDVSKLWKTSPQFISLVRNWSRVRITGGSEAGKSPLAELLVAAWQQTGRTMDVRLAFPLKGSNKNHWTIPVTHDTVPSAVKEALQVLAAKAQTNKVYVLDEMDKALGDNGKGLATDVKELMKVASHYGLGLVLIGQNANVKGWQGLDRSDFESVVSVDIGRNAYHAIENSAMSEDEKKDLKGKLEKLLAYVEQENADLDPVTDSDKLIRFALVREPNKSPCFIELPRFGSIPYLTQTVEADSFRGVVSGGDGTEVRCPVCGTSKLRKNGKTRKNEQRYKCENNHSFVGG